MPSNKELAAAIVLVILLLLLLNPFGFFMPNMMGMIIIAATLMVFAIFAVFIFRERARDERETAHKMRAGRMAFLTGSTLLIIAIAIQSLDHALDPWLVVALGGMLLAKIIGLIHSQNRY